MSGECDICGECGFECTCDKLERHRSLNERHRKIIREQLAKMFKTEIKEEEKPDGES